MIIDFHVHLFPDAIAAETVRSLAAGAGVNPRGDGTVADLLRRMDAAGVDRSVVLPVATRPDQEESILRWVSGLPRDRFEPFGAVYPRGPEAARTVHRIAESGLRGFKLHPDYQGFFVDDPMADPVYEAAVERNLIVLFHAGVDIGLPEPVHAPPIRLRKVLDRHPGLRVVLAHLGGYRMWDEVEEFLVGRDCYLDTAYVLDSIDPEQFLRIVRRHGAEKVLFATDSPWGDASDELAKLAAVGLSNSELHRIRGAAAQALLAGAGDPRAR